MADPTFLRIAFSGSSGVGKDEAVLHLTNKHNGTCLSFASPIKIIAALIQSMCGVEPFKDRNLEQWIGTYARNNYGTSCWIDYLLRALPDHSHVWVSDVRFRDELQVLRECGFAIVRLRRSAPNKLTEDQAAHVSETELFEADDDWWDYEITNDGTKGELYTQLDNLVAKLLDPL